MHVISTVFVYRLSRGFHETMTSSNLLDHTADWIRIDWIMMTFIRRIH